MRKFFAPMQTFTLMLGVCLICQSSPAKAATPPGVILTWSTDSFAPLEYEGARLPSFGSTVTVAAQLIDNDRPVIDSGAEFRWYVNGQPGPKGPNLNTLVFSTKDISPELDLYFVEVVIRGYQELPLRTGIHIPTTYPRVVITTPLPGRSVDRRGTLLTALPYFFNVASIRDLSFAWLINNVKQTTSANTLLLSGQGTGQGVSVSVSANDLEGIRRGEGNLFAPLR